MITVKRKYPDAVAAVVPRDVLMNLGRRKLRPLACPYCGRSGCRVGF